AANTRGRSGFGWFLLAAIISPLLAGLLLLALRRLSPSDVGEIKINKNAQRADLGPPLPPTQSSGPFQPDGVYAGIPYKVLEAGVVDAMMQGGLVRFRSMDQFVAAATGKTIA